MEDIISIRNAKNSAKISFFAEDILRNILGDYYTNWHGYELKEREWKALLEKLCSKIEIAVKQNIRTDYIHSERIKYYVESIRRSIVDKRNTDPEIIFALIGLSFELLGGLPENKRRNHANKIRYFDLTSKRSIKILQNEKQKVNVILESSWYKPFSEHYTIENIADKYHSFFSSDAEEFLQWYKNEFPQLYAKLF